MKLTRIPLILALLLLWAGAAQARNIDLSTIDADSPLLEKGILYLQDGDEVTGELVRKCKILVVDNASVTLNGVTINRSGKNLAEWAGITCEGNCSLVVKGENSVRPLVDYFSGIYVPEGKTLIISGSGVLDAMGGSSHGAGIGSPFNLASGNITILSGTVKAMGGDGAAGIGGGLGGDGQISAMGKLDGSVGDITILGGSITAIGGKGAAGIGGGREFNGFNSNIGTIVISDNASVTATKGERNSSSDDPAYSIGPGEIDRDKEYSFGTLTIGGVETEFITESSFVLKTYTVSFDANGGAGTMPDQKFVYGVKEKLDDNSFTRKGFYFSSWNTEPDGSGTRYEFDSRPDAMTEEAGGVVTLYAQWLEGGDLSKLTEDYRAQDGDVLTGTLNGVHKISVVDNATVTFRDVTISGANERESPGRAGINCEGNCTLIFEGENHVKAFDWYYPGIYVPENKTLTIKGSGSIESVGSNNSASGIGCGRIGDGIASNCGNIVILSGTVVAKGGSSAAGIGGGYCSNSGNITIGENASVTAIKGKVSSSKSAPYSVGPGYCDGEPTKYGVLTIDGEESEFITISPFVNKKYTVSFDGNGGEGSMENQQLTYGVKKQLNAYAFTREGYRFDCWNTEPDGSGTRYEFDDRPEAMTEEDGGVVKLYAQWFNGNLAELTADYRAKDGDVLTGALAAEYKISIVDGATVTLNGVTITPQSNKSTSPWSGITCEGDCDIILAENTENTVQGFAKNYPGIYVPANKTLTIKGSGSIDAKGAYYGAGIGCIEALTVPDCGNITILSGTVMAKGIDAAGIGGGGNRTPSGSSKPVYGHAGNILILGGTVTATGGHTAAGIGAGRYGIVGDITIKGGSVTATVDGSPYFSACVGAGSQGTAGNITISGGTVAASAASGSVTGIGAGRDGTVGNITISGGDVTAAGHGEGSSGIGAGDHGTTGKITISGGKVVATGGADAAGIGIYQNASKVDGITISGGVVEARGGKDAPGIGGLALNSSANAGVIDITDGVTLVTSIAGETDSYYHQAVCCVVHVGGVEEDYYTGYVGKYNIRTSPFVYPQYIADYGAVQIVDFNTGTRAVINGNYEGELVEITENIDVPAVELRRTFQTAVDGGFATLMLPFDIALANVEGIEALYEFSYMEEGAGYTVHITPATSIVANTPYLVKYNASSLTFTGPVTLKPTAGSSAVAKDGWEFRGVYSYKKWAEDDVELTACEGGCAYGYAAGDADNVGVGQFVRIAAGAYIYPMRAYLVKSIPVPQSGSEPGDDLIPEPKSGLAPLKAAPYKANAFNVSYESALPDHIDIVIDEKDGRTLYVGRFNTRTGKFIMNFDRGTFDAKGRSVGNRANKARGAYYGKAASARHPER